MDIPAAQRKACAFLSEHIELERCTEPLTELYGFNPSEEVLFRFKLFGRSKVGSSEYVGVSKKTGEARYLGRLGE